MKRGTKYRCIYCSNEIDLTNIKTKAVLCPNCNKRQTISVQLTYSTDYKFIVPWVITEINLSKKNQTKLNTKS